MNVNFTLPGMSPAPSAPVSRSAVNRSGGVAAPEKPTQQAPTQSAGTPSAAAIAPVRRQDVAGVVSAVSADAGGAQGSRASASQYSHVSYDLPVGPERRAIAAYQSIQTDPQRQQLDSMLGVDTFA